MCLVSRCLRSTVTPSKNEKRKKNSLLSICFSLFLLLTKPNFRPRLRGNGVNYGDSLLPRVFIRFNSPCKHKELICRCDRIDSGCRERPLGRSGCRREGHSDKRRNKPHPRSRDGSRWFIPPSRAACRYLQAHGHSRRIPSLRGDGRCGESERPVAD